MVRILRHHGFLRIGTSGSHQKWRHPFTGRAIVDGSGIEPLEWLNLAWFDLPAHQINRHFR
ncbi:MAG: type II toxin-antitoxin system HicA family toxin, partial [Bryobacteraceae bacterium]